MSLRRRLTLLSALAVALAVVVASVIVYALVRDQLRNQIDETLRERTGVATVVIGGQPFRPGQGPIVGAATGVPPQGGAPPPAGFGVQAGPGEGVFSKHVHLTKKQRRAVEKARRGAGGDVLQLPAPPRGDFIPRGQLINANGEIEQSPDAPGAQQGQASDVEIPVSDEAKQVAAGKHGEFFSNATAGGTDLRVLTVPVGPDTALQVARPLTEVNNTLSDLTLILVLVSIGGVALGGGLGLFVARTSLAPAAAVSEAARDVAQTKDLTRRIDVHGTDELGTLAASFNQMLEALEQSVGAQRRLVADASHELRTPLATLRTNIETLERRDGLSEEERKRVLEDLDAEMEELTALVGDVVELAREPAEGGGVRQDLRLDELAAEAVARARRRGRGLRFTERLDDSVVSGDPARLDRAISNLLDNAIKWSPEGGEVEVTLEGGRLEVRDHGLGFGEEGLARAFERFYRADESRGMPGSGLGLAIVQRIVSEHGGTAKAANAPDGGAVVTISLPLADS
jgi:two-component system, OmpR family, sensor histidine kinase MprB